MPGFAYLDASALVKLAVHETETPALERDVRNRDALFTSEIGAIELHRALGRTGQASTLQQAEAVLEAVFLAERVVVLSRRPGRIISDRQIDLPRTRTPELRTGAAFAREVHALYEAMKGEQP